MPSSISSACKGNLRELFNFHCAVVILMDYDEGKTARFIRTGGFAINLLVQATQYCSLLMCVCVLGELQWPLTRDAPVIRLGLRTFMFAISGLLYGLQFPPTCSTDVLDTLERVFLKFGHYEDLSESGEDCPLHDNVPQFWQRMRSRIEPLAHSTLTKLGHVPGRSPWTATDFKHSGLLRVIRMSATTKIISRAILSGSVKAIHIYIEKPKTPTRPQYEKRKTDGYGDYLMTTYASIKVFTDLVDAVEVAWMMATSTGKNFPKKKKSDPTCDVVFANSDHKNIDEAYWRWNKEGLSVFIKNLKSAEEAEKLKCRNVKYV